MVVSSPIFAEPADNSDNVQTVSEAESTDAAEEELQEETDSEEEIQVISEVSESAEEEESLIQTEEGEEEAEEEVLPSVSWTDNGDGKIDLALEHYDPDEDVKTVKFAVWSKKGGQDDLMWYEAEDDLTLQFNTRTHGDELGDYYVHVYVLKTNGTMEFVASTIGTVASIERDEPVILAKDAAGDQKKYTLTLENYEKPEDVQKVVVAVWSEKDAQDDLKWYTMTGNADGTYSYSLKISNHKSSGPYQLHVYEVKKDGSYVFLTKSGLTVTPVSQGVITVSDVDQTKGTAKVTLTDVTVPSGVTKVQIPVWSKSNQSDIYWYQAEKQSDGSYTITIDIANHKNNLGTYQIHAYATNGNGFMEKTAGTSVDIKASDAEVTAEKKDEKYILETKNISVPGGLTNVKYAVWSEENGQDDLKWLETKYVSSTSSAKYTLSLKGFTSYGKYQVHCYGTAKSGSMVYLGKTTFTVEKPSIESLEVTNSNEDGNFEITITGLNSGSGISKIQIPVWSKSNQSDIVWYDAEKTEDGTYKVTSSIAKHKYNTGTYHAHVYITEVNGITSHLDSAEFTFTKSSAGVEIGEGKNQKTFPITVKNVSVPAGAKTVRAAVWSDQNGQDDLKWYTLSGSNKGDYTGTIDISNHKTQGKYQVHVYVETKGGSSEFLGKTTFTVNSTAKASVAVTGVGSSNSAFTVQVTVDETNSSVASMQIPVWSQSNQGDIHWYTATKQSDGTWTAKVAISNHKYNLGTYQIHAYPVFTNGITAAAGGTTYTFNPANVLTSSKTGSGKREVTLRNAGSSASKVQFAVWSESKGQDDIVWYTATKQSNGNWTATVKASNHKSSGKYAVHCYVNGSYVANNSFTFAASEMTKNGWYYENGYKFYYSNGKKLTDLTAIIGAQSSYVAKVNRITCTITIYANDPDSTKGYIIPVKAFTCSVGLPGTPTTAGTHYTFAKYRWKELMGPSWGQYATKFTADGIYFHSVAGVNATSYNLNSIDYNNLGIPASHGCVRLNVRDAKWIYDNCPLGMKVIVYDSGDPGPYGKPATIKIPAGQTWDPTDPAIG